MEMSKMPSQSVNSFYHLMCIKIQTRQFNWQLKKKKKKKCTGTQMFYLTVDSFLIS